MCFYGLTLFTLLLALTGAAECKNYIPLSKRQTKEKKAGGKNAQPSKKAKSTKQAKAPKKTRVKEMSAEVVEELKAMITSQEGKVKLVDLVGKFHTSHSDIPKKLIKSKIREVAKYQNGSWNCGNSNNADDKAAAVTTKKSATNEKTSKKPSVIDLLAAAPAAEKKPSAVVSTEVLQCMLSKFTHHDI